MAIKECVVCGGSFDSHPYSKTCSEPCKKVRHNEMRAKWREENPHHKKEYRTKNREKVNSSGRDYYWRKRDERLEYANERNARLRAAHSIINRIKEEGLSALL